MKLIRGGKVVEDRDKTAYKAKCAHCGLFLDVSQFTADLLDGEIARICRTKGWEVPTRDEVALCAGCYRNHQAKLRDDIAKENAAAEQWWEAFVKAWPQKRDEERPKMEMQFRQKWPWLGSRMSAWVAKQLEASNSKTRSTDSAAGFE